MRWSLVCGSLLCALVGSACGGDDTDNSLNVSWKFPSGDCATNSVDKVRVTWGPSDGDKETAEFACADGEGTLGDAEGGSFSIAAQGVAADGRVLAEGSLGVTISGGGTGGHPFELTLRPATAKLDVSWTLSSGGTCPPGVVLPFHLTLYKAPTDGGEPTQEVDRMQESCSSGKATFMNVAPGDYILELDSRAVTPAVRGTKAVTVEPGQDAQVSLQI